MWSYKSGRVGLREEKPRYEKCFAPTHLHTWLSLKSKVILDKCPTSVIEINLDLILNFEGYGMWGCGHARYFYNL